MAENTNTTGTAVASLTEAQELKTCKVCGRTLPVSDFQRIRGGKHLDTCKDCMKKKISEGQKKSDKKNASPKEKAGQQPPVAKIVEVDVPTNILAKAEDSTLINELKRRGYTGTLTKTFTI